MSKLPSVDGLLEDAGNLWDNVSSGLGDFFSGGGKSSGDAARPAPAAVDAISPALAAGPADNSVNTEIAQDNKFYITSSDPRGAGQEVGAIMRSLVNTSNTGVALT